jgi:hypothetical protein
MQHSVQPLLKPSSKAEDDHAADGDVGHEFTKV